MAEEKDRDVERVFECMTCRAKRLDDRIVVCVYAPRDDGIEFDFDRVLSHDWIGSLPRVGDRIVSEQAITRRGAGTIYEVRSVSWILRKQKASGERMVKLSCYVIDDPGTRPTESES